MSSSDTWLNVLSGISQELFDKICLRDASGNMIRTQSGKRVVIQGLKDYIIVEKEDVLLICPKQDEQDIKAIVSDVKNNFGEDFA